MSRTGTDVQITDELGEPINPATSENQDSIMGRLNDVQNPIPTDGDSVYIKDLDIDNCTASGFTFDIGSGTETEVIEDMVSHVFVGKSNDSSDAIKTIYLQFKRPVLTTSFGINSAPGKYFSNTKITLGQGDHTWTGCDCSANSTKHQIYLFPIEPTKFSSMKIEFYTTDEIGIGLIGLFKNIEVAARIQALKPDGTVTDIGATTGGNLKVSIEEIDATAGAYQQYIDDYTTTNVTYFGKAEAGTTDAEAKWQIYTIDETGNFFVKKYADDVVNFSKTWDDRTTYAY